MNITEQEAAQRWENFASKVHDKKYRYKIDIVIPKQLMKGEDKDFRYQAELSANIISSWVEVSIDGCDLFVINEVVRKICEREQITL